MKSSPLKTIQTVFQYPSVRFALSLMLFIQLPVALTRVSFAGNTKHFSYENNLSENNARAEKKSSVSESSFLYEKMRLNEIGLDEHAFDLAYRGFQALETKGMVRKDLLTIADFSKPSTEERLFVIDLSQKKVLIKSLVAHGKNSGTVFANDFSNIPESNKSSLGFYLTLGTYKGTNGYSLQLKGLEKGINDLAYDRAIVVHGADYVSSMRIRKYGYIGRSLGCPAVPLAKTNQIINTIKNGSVLFIYHPGTNYIKKSTILK
jgi:hypothetical protein